MEKLSFFCNGNYVEILVEPDETLLFALRNRVGLNSPKCGCNRGDCGSCTVIMDGKAVKSCTVLALTAEGKHIITAEGLGTQVNLHPVQKAMIAYGAPQCGYCTPGMLAAAVAFLNENPHPTEYEIKDALAGNLCRCGGYREYIEAVKAASKGEFGEIKRGELNV